MLMTDTMPKRQEGVINHWTDKGNKMDRISCVIVDDDTLSRG